MVEGDKRGRVEIREEEETNFKKSFQCKKQNLILPKESIPMKDMVTLLT